MSAGLQQQIDDLREQMAALRAHQAEQDKLRELQREGEEAIERSLSHPVPSRRLRGSRPARPLTERPAHLSLAPGGVA